MKKTLLLIALSGIIMTTYAQKIVEATAIDTLSQDELNSVFVLFGLSVDNGLYAYKVLYETLDTDGSIDTASGLVVLPILEEDNSVPIVAYQHGTSSDKMDVPSRITQEAFLIYYMAGQGMVGVAADYLGLGDSRRAIHPYVHADTEASAAIDLLRAAKEIMATENLVFSEQLFITGYSQGGHAGMAMHKAIETNHADEFTVTAASPMSGPYNLSATTINSSINDEIYDFPSYVVWMFVAYQSVYGTIYEDLNTVFRPEFVPAVEQFALGEITRGELNDLLVDQLTELHGASYSNRMFQVDFITDLQTNPDNPMGIALRDNDLFDWVPEAPTQLLYCMADEQVNFRNAVFTDSIMNANGAASVTSIDILSEGSHGDCVIPATINSVQFFLSFIEGNTTSTQAINPDLAFQLRPNPASQQVHIDLPSHILANSTGLKVQLRSLQGQLLVDQSIDYLTTPSLDVSTYPNGLYLVQIQGTEGVWVEKVLVQR